ncbi:MAG: hypothetical protein KDA53_01240 [Hyphomonas sp.]|nr:hypothetical protein [Hyphomonas sp.]
MAGSRDREAQAYWRLNEPARAERDSPSPEPPVHKAEKPEKPASPEKAEPGARLVRVSVRPVRSGLGRGSGLMRLLRLAAMMATLWSVLASGFFNLLAAIDLYNRFVGDIAALLEVPIGVLTDMYAEAKSIEFDTHDGIRNSVALILGLVFWGGSAAISWWALRRAREEFLFVFALMVAAPAGYAWWARLHPTGYESGLQPELVIPLLAVLMAPFAVRMIWARLRHV